MEGAPAAAVATQVVESPDFDGDDQDDEPAAPAADAKAGPMAQSRAALEALIRTLEQRTGAAAPAPAAAASAPAQAPPAASAAKPKAGKGEKDPWANVVLQVGRIVQVERHATAERLYVCQVDLGKAKDGQPIVRQLVSGIVPYYPDEAVLRNRLIAVLTNLKAAKLKGKDSLVMLLAATAPDGGVRLVDVPAGCEPGERVVCEGVEAAAEAPKVLSDKNLAAALAGLRVRAGHATYYDHVLRTAHGPLAVPGLPDGAPIK